MHSTVSQAIRFLCVLKALTYPSCIQDVRRAVRSSSKPIPISSFIGRFDRSIAPLIIRLQSSAVPSPEKQEVTLSVSASLDSRKSRMPEPARWKGPDFSNCSRYNASTLSLQPKRLASITWRFRRLAGHAAPFVGLQHVWGLLAGGQVRTRKPGRSPSSAPGC